MPHRRILTRDDIKAIRQLRGNMPMSEIADRYRISYQRIYKILKHDSVSDSKEIRAMERS
ncbi:hypothetical protein ACJMK2_027471, partial [Sinanodonta woodiana]